MIDTPAIPADAWERRNESRIAHLQRHYAVMLPAGCGEIKGGHARRAVASDRGETWPNVLECATALRRSDSGIRSAIADGRMLTCGRRLRYADGKFRHRCKPEAPESPPRPSPPPYVQKQYRSIAEISTTVECYYQLNPGAISGPRRFKELAIARQVAMYLCREVGRKTVCDIGRHLRRDHTTVSHGAQVIQARMATDPQLTAQVGELATQLRS